MAKLNILPEQIVNWTSDIHYSHKNICRGESSWEDKSGCRDFDTVEEMNDTIITNINHSVEEHHILICLGDWSFGGFDNIRELRDQINCKEIHLVLGNHDHHIARNRDNIQDIFASVSDYLVVDYLQQKIVCSHYPMRVWEGMERGDFHLYGHVHSSPEERYNNNRSMDVGLEGNNYYPYSSTNLAHALYKGSIEDNYHFK